MSEEAITIGVDPGLHGAIAVIQGNKLLRVDDIPTQDVSSNGGTRRRVDVMGLKALLEELPLAPVWIEDVHSMPRDSHVSAFRFGHTVGIIQAAFRLSGFQLYYVPPQVWKAAMILTKEKSAATALASTMFGTDEHWPLKKHDGRAEAALIAAYGYNKDKRQALNAKQTAGLKWKASRTAAQDQC